MIYQTLTDLPTGLPAHSKFFGLKTSHIHTPKSSPLFDLWDYTLLFFVVIYLGTITRFSAVIIPRNNFIVTMAADLSTTTNASKPIALTTTSSTENLYMHLNASELSAIIMKGELSFLKNKKKNRFPYFDY